MNDKILIPLIKRTFPQLIAADILGVQPMSGPTGLAFALRHQYEKPKSGVHIHRWSAEEDKLMERDTSYHHDWCYSKWSVVGEEQKDGTIKVVLDRTKGHPHGASNYGLILTREQFNKKYFVEAL